MDSTRFVTWLKDENLFETVKNHTRIFKLLLLGNLKPNKRSTFLIAGDTGTRYRRAPAILLGCYLLAAKRLGLNYELAIQRPKRRGEAADDTIVEAFSRLSQRSFIALSLSGKLGSLKKIGKSFRKFIRFNDHRFVSTTGLSELKNSDFSRFARAIDVDYASLERKGNKLKRLLDEARMVRIVTDAGTHLKIGVEGMIAIANSGVYQHFGGNMPGGEVYIPPKKNQAEGTLIIDGSVKLLETTVLIKEPIRIAIQEGRIKRITGGKEAGLLRETFHAAESRAKYPWGIKRVGELGIGINPKAGIIGPTIVNEKSLGTAHLAFGSNAWFGGSVFAITHLDQVFLKPKIWIDGKRVLIQ